MTDVTVTAERHVSPIAEVRHQLAAMEEQFKFALPAHIPVERFARVVMTAIQNNPKLVTNCTRQSLWNAAMKAAQDGLLPDGREGAIVQNVDQAGWRPMIAGIRKKVRNSGEIATWDVHVVHAKDKFAYRLGDDPFIMHEPSLEDDPGPTIAAYSIAVLKSGEKSRDVMTMGAIRRIRDRSDAWKAYKANKIKSTPWQTDEDEMAKKTVARRHSKVLPMSTDLDDLIRRDDDLYQAGDQNEDGQVDRPNTLAGKLDMLAAMPTTVSPAVAATIEQTDPETGEVTETNANSAASAPTGEKAGDAKDAGSVTFPADPAIHSSSTQPKDAAASAASGQAAPESVNPSKVQDKGAATAPLPKTEAEYVKYAEAWIDALDDVEGEKRWPAEKSLRNKANVGGDAREALQALLAKKVAEIKDADRS